MPACFKRDTSVSLKDLLCKLQIKRCQHNSRKIKMPGSKEGEQSNTQEGQMAWKPVGKIGNLRNQEIKASLAIFKVLTAVFKCSATLRCFKW